MPEKMKATVFLTIDFPPQGGGMSRHGYEVVSALRQEQCNVVVIAPAQDAQDGPYEGQPLEVLRVNRIKASEVFNEYLRSVREFLSCSFLYCSSNKVDVVLAHTWTIAGVTALLLKMTLGIPYFVFVHGLDVYQCKNNLKARLLMRLVLSNARGVIANSSFTKNLLYRMVPQHKITVIHPAIDHTQFQCKESLGNVRAGKYVILTVARLVESKGQEAVIRALPVVLEKYPNVIYEIIGQGPYENALRQLVNKLGLDEHVIFEGHVADKALPAHYHRCDLFIMVSKPVPKRGEVEGFGIVFLEAGACGKPVIGAKTGGIPDAVVDGQTGILVDPLDSEAIASSIIRLLSNEEMRKSMGEEAKRRVESQFTMSALGQQLKKAIYG